MFAAGHFQTIHEKKQRPNAQVKPRSHQAAESKKAPEAGVPGSVLTPSIGVNLRLHCIGITFL